MIVKQVKAKLPRELKVSTYICQKCGNEFTIHLMDKVKGIWYAWPQTPNNCPKCGKRLE